MKKVKNIIIIVLQILITYKLILNELLLTKNSKNKNNNANFVFIFSIKKDKNICNLFLLTIILGYSIKYNFNCRKYNIKIFEIVFNIKR